MPLAMSQYYSSTDGPTSTSMQRANLHIDATVPEAAVPSPANVSGSGDSITLLPAEVGNGGEGDAVALPFPEDVQGELSP